MAISDNTSMPFIPPYRINNKNRRIKINYPPATLNKSSRPNHLNDNTSSYMDKYGQVDIATKF